MNRLALVALALLVTGMSHQGVGPCRPGDKRCMPTAPLLSILKGGPTSSQMASGALQTAKGANVTDSRASSVYCADASGVLHLLSNNQPCTEASGLRAEGQSTNLLLQSNAPATSPWTTYGAGTGTAPVVTNNTTDVTDPAGGNTAAKIIYPAVSGAGGTNNVSIIRQSVTTSAASYVLCARLRVLSGTATVYLENGDSTTSPYAACNVTSSWTRCSLSAGSLTAASHNFDLGVNLNTTGEAQQPAQTIYAAKFQLEQGTVCSSDIDTTTTSATRAADVPSSAAVAIGTHPSFSGDATPALLTSGTQYLTQGYVSGSDRWDIVIAPSEKLLCEYYNGTTAFDANSSNTFTAGQKNHWSCSYDGTNVKACLNGTCTLTPLTFTTLSTTYTPYFGYSFADSGGGGLPLMGYESSLCWDSSSRCQ